MPGIFNAQIFNNAIFNIGTTDAVSCEYFFTNFEDSSIGDSPPSGWTARGPSGYQSLAVAHSSPPFKRRVATLSSEDGATVAFSVDAIDAFAGRADIDVVIAVYRDASDDHERVALHVRGQGSGTITAGYEFGIDFTNQRIRIYKRVAGVVTTPFADLSISHPADAYRLYRLRANGSATTDLKARIWAPGETEPTTWGLSESDSSSPITAAGWVGFGGYVPSGLGSSKLNFFSAASGGCSAYVPVLNDAFNTWLAGRYQRCVLAEMSAVGYDSVGSPAATKTVNVYIANMGFTSKATDTPPNRHYNAWIKKIPTFKREMSIALSGRATIGFGSLVVSNTAWSIGGSGAGVRDDWLRMKWNRDYVTLYMGDVRWRKSDFRKILVGVLGNPKASQGLIEFEISDLLERLNRQLQTNTFDDGPFENKLRPIALGTVSMEPVPVDDALLERQFHDGPVVSFGPILYDNGVPLSVTGEVASIDGATNVLTTVDPHGMSEGFRVIFDETWDPLPATGGSTYYVIASGLGSDTFKISATPGGTEIDLTGFTSTHPGYVANFFVGYGWTKDEAAGTVTLIAPAAGRIVGSVSTIADARPANVIDDLIFERFGLPRDFKDEDKFDALSSAMPSPIGLPLYDEPESALSVLERISSGILGWYGAAVDGLLQVGVIGLPDTLAVMEFRERDVKAGSLRLTNRILPVNPATIETRRKNTYWLYGQPNPADFATTTESQAMLSEYTVIERGPTYTPTTPLDDYPDAADMQDRKPFLALCEVAGRVAALYKKTLGVFQFQTTLRAMTLSIGDTVQLEHSRLGWRQWDNYDPASPDNTADIDATKAVVIGIDVNLSASDPFPVTLTVFRQIPGYYPEEDLN